MIWILNSSFLALLGVSPLCLNAQESRFFMPLEIQKAYHKNTRSYDGHPGVNYWQNTADYKIKVAITPSEKLIDGYESVVFINNSPDEINKLVIRLYGDAYKKGNQRLVAVDQKDINDGVELKEITIDGIIYDFESPNKIQRNGTNISLQLVKPLKPGSNLTLEASWKQKIPSFSKIKTGAYDSTSFFIAYWYPQIAVYDDIFGWDESNYLFNTEFYNNLGNYDVEITVPDKYVVWATGTLSNAADVLPKEIFDKYQRARSSEKETQIISAMDIEKGFSSLHSSWHYTANDVTDFAFAISDHYVWDAAMQPIADYQVFVSSVRPLEKNMVSSNHLTIERKAIQFFSQYVPGIPFPFEAFTTVINKGADGMEYPMLANIRSTDRQTTIHEIFHSYFPMSIRTNERMWAWMDEGWANYNTRLMENRIFNNDFEEENLFSITSSNLGTIFDLPLITPSQFLTERSYVNVSYLAPDMVYAILHQYLGEELFSKCYREYITRWTKKSPTPYDFFYTFENVSDKDLSWLWKPWFFEFGYADLAIKSFEKDRAIIINKGNKPIPVFIEVIYKDDRIKHITETAYVWATGQKEFQIVIPDYENVKVILLNKTFFDINPYDNIYPFETMPLPGR